MGIYTRYCGIDFSAEQADYLSHGLCWMRNLTFKIYSTVNLSDVQKTHTSCKKKIYNFYSMRTSLDFYIGLCLLNFCSYFVQIADPEKCDQVYDSLARINSAYYKNKVLSVDHLSPHLHTPNVLLDYRKLVGRNLVQWRLIRIDITTETIHE